MMRQKVFFERMIREEQEQQKREDCDVKNKDEYTQGTFYYIMTLYR